MIDATRTPRRFWRKLINVLIVASLIVMFAWLIWVKELHHTDVHVHALLRLGSALPLTL